MQRLEVNGAVRPIYGSLGVKLLTRRWTEGSSSLTPFREGHVDNTVSRAPTMELIFLKCPFDCSFNKTGILHMM